MATPVLDFSHLSPEQRIELAKQLWASLDPATVGPPTPTRSCSEVVALSLPPTALRVNLGVRRFRS